MHWTQPIDLYCERTNATFWAEPVNALSNAAFLIAAVLAYMAWRATPRRDAATAFLIALTAVIGTGSFIFHTVATAGAELFDTVPIGIFIYVYLFLALRRFLGLPLVAAGAALVLFAAASYAEAAYVPAGALNGSSAYLPALAAMIAVGLLAQNGKARRTLLAAGGLFALSLVFRSIDNAVCRAWPLGTHFLWHCLNAVVLYTLLRAAIDAPQRKAA